MPKSVKRITLIFHHFSLKSNGLWLLTMWHGGVNKQAKKGSYGEPWDTLADVHTDRALLVNKRTLASGDIGSGRTDSVWTSGLSSADIKFALCVSRPRGALYLPRPIHDADFAKRRCSKLEIREKASVAVERPLFGGSVLLRIGRCAQRHENEGRRTSSYCRPSQALSEAWSHSYP
jgi:hypothetical protein